MKINCHISVEIRRLTIEILPFLFDLNENSIIDLYYCSKIHTYKLK